MGGIMYKNKVLLYDIIYIIILKKSEATHNSLGQNSFIQENKCLLFKLKSLSVFSRFLPQSFASKRVSPLLNVTIN